MKSLVQSRANTSALFRQAKQDGINLANQGTTKAEDELAKNTYSNDPNEGMDIKDKGKW